MKTEQLHHFYIFFNISIINEAGDERLAQNLFVFFKDVHQKDNDKS